VAVAVETFQNEWEIEQLVALYDRLRATRVLEIGTWHGGTLWHWMRPGTTVVVIDDEMRMAHLWQEWADEVDAELWLLYGLSQSPEAVDKAAELGPYDFIFIDGDHRYEAVQADWDNYSPLVAEGGVVVLHDILPRPGYGVSELWAELRAREGARWIEICHNEVQPGNEGTCGIGAIWP
jgi:predicted O-methyltransferase YrrM